MILTRTPRRKVVYVGTDLPKFLKKNPVMEEL